MCATDAVATHYGSGTLLDRIAAGVERLGLPRHGLDPSALSGVGEFHIGGAAATERLFDQLDVPSGARVLDVGCGIGGTARHVAARTGARVTGIDLTGEFVATGKVLTDWCGMADRVTLIEGSALSMPFGTGDFDLAYMLHVGMNIADKTRLMAEVARVLKPGAVFAIYDVMRVAPGEIAYPVPWAAQPGISALASPHAYLDALTAAGFALVAQTDRTEFALDFFATLAARAAAADGPPPLGLHLVMGPSAPDMVANMARNIRAGLIAPVEMIVRRR
ncbi:MAG: methyltransferase domain-containing protein [Rhodobacteraceae bacterium]|nr:methyltransferase domain-containing protein [Paracoccaceae bacterium]